MDRWLNKAGKQKKWLTGLLAIMALLLSYRLGIAKTWDAAMHNKQLKKAVTGQTGHIRLDLRRKAAFYTGLLKYYQVKNGQWEDQLWQSLSGIAAARNVKIFYQAQPLLADSAASEAVVFCRFEFTGNYGQLVSVLDSIDHTAHIGRIVRLDLKAPANHTGLQEPLRLKLTIAGLKNSNYEK